MVKWILLAVISFLISGITLESLLLESRKLTEAAAAVALPTQTPPSGMPGSSVANHPPARQPHLLMDGSPRPTPAPVLPAGSQDCRPENLADYSAPPETGTVLEVIDGDTLLLRLGPETGRVRLWGIDAPELAQAGGAGARQYLESLVPEQSEITVYPVSVDSYQRRVAVLDDGTGTAVNWSMLARGWAYHHRQYDRTGNGCLAGAEQTARQGRWGVWREGSQGGERPWDFRHRRLPGTSI